MYYHNISTGGTAWELPEGASLIDSPQPYPDAHSEITMEEVKKVAKSKDKLERIEEKQPGAISENDDSFGDLDIPVDEDEVPESGEEDEPSLGTASRDYLDYISRSNVANAGGASNSETNPLGIGTRNIFRGKYDAKLVDSESSIVELINMFGSFFMEEFVEQNYNFERRGIFKAR